jgi:L-ascorbate metabolism protein UlaG (beta-lactamase superfamily)
MSRNELSVTYVGGPTALLEFCGLRFLTDPTFDPADGVYTSATGTLTKTAGPAIAPDALGRVDAVLLSHDHHSDNLDRAGRLMLAHAGCVLTTAAGAERLGNAAGMEPWETHVLEAPDGRRVTVTATPARHGPDGGDRGPVTGFVLSCGDSADATVYVSGDTVWYRGVAEVAQRFNVGTAVLFMGAARVGGASAPHLTMTAEDGVSAARAFRNASIVPLHFEGWRHFTESRNDIARVFDAAGLGARLRWPRAGHMIIV